MITSINLHVKQGKNVAEAVLQGASDALRPMLKAALVVIGGLLVSPALMLFVLASLDTRLTKAKEMTTEEKL